MDSEAVLKPSRPAIDRLDPDAIAAALAPEAARLVEALDVLDEIDSTNRYLLERCPSPGRLSVCLAEYQHAGRGRRGRAFRAPAGAALCLSVAWRFAERPRDLPALTLACGVAARRAIGTLVPISVQLKWPNDLVWDDRKLGGILVELASGARPGCHVVVGIGVNVAMPREWLRRVSDWPRGAVDLNEATGGEPPRRSALAAALVDALAEVLASYASMGFAPYRAEFEAADWLRGRSIRLEEKPGEAVEGVARGIEEDGALRVELGDGQVRRVRSADVSVRWGRSGGR